MRNDLHLEIDSITGEPIHTGGGLIDAVLNRGSVYEYKMFAGADFYKMLKDCFRSFNPLIAFTELLKFPHFRPYQEGMNEKYFDFLFQSIYKNPLADVPKEHPLDKMLYSHARDFEIKMMKRMRAYIELENQL